MFCENCGTKLPADAVFCPDCGEKVNIENVSEKAVTAQSDSNEGKDLKASDNAGAGSNTGLKQKNVEPAGAINIQGNEGGPKETEAKKASDSAKTEKKSPLVPILIGFVVVLMIAVVVLSIKLFRKDDSVYVKPEDSVNTEEAVEETADSSISDTVEPEGEVAEEEPVRENPLKGQEVIYAGAYGENDTETAILVNRFLDNVSAVPEDILMVNVDDFEGKGDVYAFVFAGVALDEEGSFGSYEGTMYFVGDEVTQLQSSETDAWWTVDGTIKTPGRQYQYAREAYTTGGRSIIWSVYDGQVGLCEISGFGDIAQNDLGEIAIVVSAYDSAYDDGILLGHSWRTYFFYYDEDRDAIVEYGGAFVDPSQIDEIAGTNITEQIDKAGGIVTTAYYHENGLLNVNYINSGYEAGHVDYNNAVYDCFAGEFLPAFISEDEPSLENSNRYGIYVGRIAEGLCDATYPEVKKSTKRCDVAILNPSEMVPCYNSDGYQIHGKNADNFVDTVSFVVDENTEFGSDDMNLFNMRNRYMTVTEWFDAMVEYDYESDSELETLGIYDVEITNGHADKIYGKYWWD